MQALSNKVGEKAAIYDVNANYQADLKRSRLIRQEKHITVPLIVDSRSLIAKAFNSVIEPIRWHPQELQRQKTRQTTHLPQQDDEQQTKKQIQAEVIGRIKALPTIYQEVMWLFV